MPSKHEFEPGTVLYFTSDLGDYNSELKESFVVPKGTPGILTRYFYRDDGPNGKPYMAEIAVPTSPAQKVLTVRAEEISTFYTMEPPAHLPTPVGAPSPEPPPDLLASPNRWERLRQPFLGETRRVSPHPTPRAPERIRRSREGGSPPPQREVQSCCNGTPGCDGRGEKHWCLSGPV
jgi:hypothetical protein